MCLVLCAPVLACPAWPSRDTVQPSHWLTDREARPLIGQHQSWCKYCISCLTTLRMSFVTDQESCHKELLDLNDMKLYFKINCVRISIQLKSQRCICAEPHTKLRLGKSNSFTGAFKWTSPLQSLSVDMWKSEWEDVITWWLSYWDDGNRSCGALDSDWSLWGYH